MADAKIRKTLNVIALTTSVLISGFIVSPAASAAVSFGIGPGGVDIHYGNRYHRRGYNHGGYRNRGYGYRHRGYGGGHGRHYRGHRRGYSKYGYNRPYRYGYRGYGYRR